MSFKVSLVERCYDEMFVASGEARALAGDFVRQLRVLSGAQLQHHQRQADLTLRNMGITFSVYGHKAGVEKVWPFDIVPRIIGAREWEHIERGLCQRIRALNLFLSDIYEESRIVADRVVPQELVMSSKAMRGPCIGFRPPKGVWCHITGTDLIRDEQGQIYVLEDNLRCPSGVSYVLENREVMKRIFPEGFDGLSVVPVEGYPERLLQTLMHTAPPGVSDPTVVVLTPGIYNSAYFEHSYLAQQMGVELVESSDLVVSKSRHLFMRTTKGLRRVDVIYRRIDDDYLDPKYFRHDSMLGISGLMDVYRAGHVTLANAPGTGVADDKALYAYVPQIIKYYLGEDPILPNVPTYVCWDKKKRDHVLANLESLVVKPTNESGGYGILMGPQASQEERDACAKRIQENPRNYIAQPMLNLSTVPTIVENSLEARHVDLRPFVLLSGDEIYVLPGGLTRVALRKGCMVVNSSQGGGSKDTWVLSRRSLQDPSVHLGKKMNQQDNSI